jgi:hypothetical protein
MEEAYKCVLINCLMQAFGIVRSRPQATEFSFFSLVSENKHLLKYLIVLAVTAVKLNLK